MTYRVLPGFITQVNGSYNDGGTTATNSISPLPTEYNVINCRQSTDPALLVVRNNQQFFQKLLTEIASCLTIET